MGRGRAICEKTGSLSSHDHSRRLSFAPPDSKQQVWLLLVHEPDDRDLSELAMVSTPLPVVTSRLSAAADLRPGLLFLAPPPWLLASADSVRRNSEPCHGQKVAQIVA